eukprot:1115982-Pleurochrysis_carterae.AAC.1
MHAPVTGLDRSVLAQERKEPRQQQHAQRAAAMSTTQGGSPGGVASTTIAGAGNAHEGGGRKRRHSQLQPGSTNPGDVEEEHKKAKACIDTRAMTKLCEELREAVH